MNLQDSIVLLEACPFCEHRNPADSKFCSACGGALHLMPCPRCGAVSDVTATSCYQCHGALPGRGKDTPDIPEIPAEPPRPLPRSRAPTIVGIVTIAGIALIGYYSYHKATYVDTRTSPQGASVTPGTPMGVDTTPAKTIQPGTPLAGAAPAATKQPREDRKPVESGAAKGTAVPAARTKGTNEGRTREADQPRPIACTEAVAALGLCTLKPAKKIGAEAAVAGKPVIARSKADDAGEAGQQGARRQEACTNGAVALGLCAPRIPQEGK